MKLVETHDFLDVKLFSRSRSLKDAWRDIEAAIRKTDWPHGCGTFRIYPQSGKKRKQGNGVVPIKKPCVAELRRRGWLTESLPNLSASVLETGDLDALLLTKAGYVAFEWETGNISSSHRAINKLLLALREKAIVAGVLVVPSNKLKIYLTDRIGNIGELRPYFKLWQTLKGISGAFRIAVVEHDIEDPRAPRIPKGTDGRARS